VGRDAVCVGHAGCTGAGAASEQDSIFWRSVLRGDKHRGEPPGVVARASSNEGWSGEPGALVPRLAKHPRRRPPRGDSCELPWAVELPALSSAAPASLLSPRVPAAAPKPYGLGFRCTYIYTYVCVCVCVCVCMYIHTYGYT
jgi:hypothetical protein